MRQAFINPKDGSEYQWFANHETENRWRQERKLSATEPTAAAWEIAVPRILQQRADDPEVMELAGKSHTVEQHSYFTAFTVLCKKQTIFFRHFTGAVFEVLITSYRTTQQPVVRSAADEHYNWPYTLTMEIINAL